MTEVFTKLKELWDATTDGEWQTRFLYRMWRSARAYEGTDVQMMSDADHDWHDADFTAYAHNSVPQILAEVERLQAVNHTNKRCEHDPMNTCTVCATNRLLVCHEDNMAMKRNMAKLLDEITELKCERDAYKKAKAENDERFQLEIGELKARIEKIQCLVNAQAEDVGLWSFPEGRPQYIAEAHLQQELRNLHKVIEGSDEK